MEKFMLLIKYVRIFFKIEATNLHANRLRERDILIKNA